MQPFSAFGGIIIERGKSANLPRTYILTESEVTRSEKIFVHTYSGGYDNDYGRLLVRSK